MTQAGCVTLACLPCVEGGGGQRGGGAVGGGLHSIL